MNKEIARWLGLAINHFNLENITDMDQQISSFTNQEYIEYILNLKESLKHQGISTPDKNSIIGFISWRRVQSTQDHQM